MLTDPDRPPFRLSGCQCDGNGAASGSQLVSAASSGGTGTPTAAPVAPPPGPQGAPGPAGPMGPRGFPGGSPSFTATAPPCNATGGGVADDTQALQRCIDAAAAVGGTVHLPVGRYLTTTTLTLPGGVRLEGDGTGDNPLQISQKGSVIVHTGGAVPTVLITGHTASIARLALFDAPHTSTAGIAVIAAGRLIESIVLNELLIYGYTSGVGLAMNATGGGGIGYSSAYDLRIRNAKTGIRLHSDGTNFSFVNSNAFYGGAISGGGYDYGIHVVGPGSVNNNVFENLVVEPFTSTYGHLVVEGPASWVEVYGSRFEAAQQDPATPIIRVAPESGENRIEAIVGHSWVDIDAHSNPGVRLATGKAVIPNDPNTNILLNSDFLMAFDLEDSTIGSSTGLSYWLLQGGCTATRTVDPAAVLYSQFAVLSVSVPPGSSCTLRPSEFESPGDFARLATFGAYVSSTVEGSAFATARGHVNLIQSSSANAAGRWSFVGLQVGPHINSALSPLVFVGLSVIIFGMQVRMAGQSLVPTLHLSNSGSGSTTINVTSPLLTFGGGVPTAGVTAGSSCSRLQVVLYNTSHAPNPSFPTYHTVPTHASLVRVSGANAIARLNHIGGSRFPYGSVLILLVESGSSVVFINSIYIALRAPWNPTTDTKIALLAGSSGTWEEMWRS